MAERRIPQEPSLEQYRKQSKDLLKRGKSGDPDALQRIERHHPRPGKVKLALADAQLVIAREHGFESWPKFAKYVDAFGGTTQPSAIWRSAERAVLDGDASALDELLHDHRELFRDEGPPSYVPKGPRPDYSALDARTIIAREHQFESWSELERHLAARHEENSPIAAFEAAVDATVAGDVITLAKLLRGHPDLAQARSTRKHHATLLHYVAANGVEGFRQRTPDNAVAVAAALLDAGADVDAACGIYGGEARTLALVATSIHPRLAGVQDSLIELLLDRGASLDAGRSLVNDCLANGRGKAAELLAERGAPLDLEGAAGVGRLDVVRAQIPSATATERRDGFAWACQFGRSPVAELLLQAGVEVDARLRHHGQTGLHWAAYGGHADTVALLLRSGAAVDAKDETWGSTPLWWALYGWSEGETDAPGPYPEVVAALVAAGAEVKPEWLRDEKVRADPGILAALSGALPLDA